LAKPNYAFAKRQRDLAKKVKKEEKRLRKAAKNQAATQDTAPAPETGDDKASPAPDAEAAD
jgi:hypothetical protein